MTLREHSRLSRALIAACGGLDEAAENCRVSKSKLSDYQNANVELYMPADVMACLEEFCGQPIYSAGLLSRFNAPTLAGCLAVAAQKVTEAAAACQGTVREALDDGILTPREIDEIASAERSVGQALENLQAIRRQHEERGAK